MTDVRLNWMQQEYEREMSLRPSNISYDDWLVIKGYKEKNNKMKIEEISRNKYPQLYDEKKQAERNGWEKGANFVLQWLIDIGKPKLAERFFNEK